MTVAPDEGITLEELVAIRNRLLRKLTKQRKRVLELLAWYRCEQDPPGLAQGYAKALYRQMALMSRNGWARLVIDSISERLEVQGFRSENAAVEAEAWKFLQANEIDANQGAVHTEALIASLSYVLVVPGKADGEVSITPETALEVAHEWEPGSKSKVAAAIKAFPIDEDGKAWRCELYTTDRLVVWEVTSSWKSKQPPEPRLWDATPTADGVHTTGIVSMIPFVNRALPSVGPTSELHDLVNIFERIDELTLDRQTAAHFAAFRQRWATGLEVPRDPTTGKPVEPFKAAVERLWISEDEKTKFGTFESTDLSQYLKAIDAEVAQIAAVSRVPAHYLMANNLANPPSAESLVAAESGLVKKIHSRQKSFGESWEEVIRLGFKILGNDAGASDTSTEIIWADPQVRHPAQVADAATKYSTFGVPREALWEFIGATPQQIARWKVMKAQDDLEAAAASPPAGGNVPKA